MTCIIIEDERPSQNLLKNYLSKLPNMELLGVFQSAIQAHNYFKTSTADVVFLDVNLPDISGIDFIKSVKNAPSIIMTTAYPDYAVSCFELDTIVDYLVKPFGFDRFLIRQSLIQVGDFLVHGFDVHRKFRKLINHMLLCFLKLIQLHLYLILKHKIIIILLLFLIRMP